jgi:hypothetical protein
MINKNTFKVQALISEEDYLTLQRIIFWDKVNGSNINSTSAWVRNLIQAEIESRPDTDKQSIKNFKR